MSIYTILSNIKHKIQLTKNRTSHCLQVEECITERTQSVTVTVNIVQVDRYDIAQPYYWLDYSRYSSILAQNSKSVENI